MFRKTGVALRLLVGLAGMCFGGCHPNAPSPLPSKPAPSETKEDVRVQVIHFSDYHAHAIPFFSEHKPDQGGLARTLAYVSSVREKHPNTLVFSGGDMWNAGTPAWSDKYSDGCLDWKWLGESVSVMAFGNHDVDYGWDAFSRCRKESGMQILSGNLVTSEGQRLLDNGGTPYIVKTIEGVRIGVFALAGSDFAKLVKPANLPTGAKFLDPIVTAKDIVSSLREKEHVSAVVFIGHQDRDADFAMAKQVPGIDLILGTHSHHKGVFQQIPETQTYFISPYQYLCYLSHVELAFHLGKLTEVNGKLVRMDSELPQDAAVAKQTLRMQQDLEADPKYARLFEVVGSAKVELDVDGIEESDTPLGNFVMDTVRDAAQTQVALSSASSFRASIPPGPIRNEDYLSALPYRNKILSFSMTGAQLQAVMDFSASQQGKDLFGVTSGIRFAIAPGTGGSGKRATDIWVRKSATDADLAPLQKDAKYTVMATDYLANIATGYKDLFAPVQPPKDTGKIVNDTVLDFIRRNTPVSAKRDGRVR
ncbi:MAG TPA: bifunctional UDP-sugar hydrolase/5'-nucleotidase [Pseudomonadota bacterium]|nr:bifunctional UDP-sugar hydrolase/5'-nucleotidase [Pseudomonadota bacterium]